MLLLFLLLLTSTDDSRALRIPGTVEDGSCLCEVNPTVWMFPAVKYESVLQQVHACEGSLKGLQEQLKISIQRFPQILAEVSNLTARIQPFQNLHQRGLYSALPLRQLGKELDQLEADIGSIHSQLKDAMTLKLSKEVAKLCTDVNRLQTTDTVNMQTIREKLRNLKNSVEACKSIPLDFRGHDKLCYRGLITNISDPVTTKISSYGTTFTSGSWGKQAQMDSEEYKNNYWVLPLLSRDISTNTVRVYQTYEDFMASTNHEDIYSIPSYTDAKAIEGPSAVLYGEALYYHCYDSADICRYDLKTKLFHRVTLPGTGVGFNNKFPYCYYDCWLNSDVDVEADEKGVWAIYATMGNHGNMVVSRLMWDNEAQTLNVSHTWETRLFKKAASNAFMVCGVLYATRYIDEYREEVYYAFDTASGKEDNSLSLPLEKVAKGVSSLSYNPTDRQLYMYNEGYLLTYQTYF